ncbi:MAG: lipid-A-disaccharide kinase, partial [Deltaproteobacteria bacterium]|nr:lipid-A-disaccharide kinase [Deltaproteobacteria bacterium]
MIPLAGLSYLYGLAVRIRTRVYKNRRKKELPGFVLSIGNLTVGGTGKTPAAAMIADWALKEGYRPAILSRGYGSKHGGKIFEVSDGQHLSCTPAQAGDEAYLLAKNLPGVPVILSKARYEAGLLAQERHGSDFFILDDGLSSVDIQTEERVLEGLEKFLRGRTSILVTHRIAPLRRADRIIVLEEGQVAEMGDHGTL